MNTLAQQFYQSGAGGASSGVPKQVVYPVTDESPSPLAIDLGGLPAPSSLVQVAHNGLIMAPDKDFEIQVANEQATVVLLAPRESFATGDILLITAQIS